MCSLWMVASDVVLSAAAVLLNYPALNKGLNLNLLRTYASSQGCVLVKWHDSVWDWLDIRLLIEFFLPLRTRGNSKWTSKWIISKERQHCRKDSYRRCAFNVECFVKIKNVHMIANKTINNIHSFFHLLFSEFTILGNLFASTQRYVAQRPIQRNNCKRCLPWFCSVANNNRNDDDDSDLVIREMINYILKFNIFRNCKVEWRSYLLFLLSFGAIKNN